MKSLIFILMAIFVFSCGRSDKGQLQYFKTSKTTFNKLVNKSTAQRGDVYKDLSVQGTYRNKIGMEYLVQMALYEDGHFKYDIEALGVGEGTWKYEDGIIKLSNYRYFHFLGKEKEMNYEIKAMDEEGKNFMIFFRDRLGFQSSPITIKNK